jgi:phage gp36-like protein
MPYATQQDMIDRFEEAELIQLTDHENTGTVNVVVLGQALADADALIDGYLASRYTLPLAIVPKTIVRMACEIARYFLYDNLAPDEVRRRYEDAEKFLAALAKGSITLGPDPDDAGSAGAPEVSTPGRLFTHETLSDF